MKNKFLNLTTASMIAMALLFQSCGKDEDPVEEPHVHNDSELITTVTLTLTDAEGGFDPVTATFSDPDGPGGADPTIIDTLRLHPGLLYYGTIAFKNESVSPVVDLTSEINSEKQDHIVCYTVSDANVLVTRTDTDGNYEVGLTTNWVTASADLGQVTVTLKHQPGTKDGTCDPGETDAEVTFPIKVE